MTTWEEMLWEELNSLNRTDQIVLAGDIITRMTRVLLPALGSRRRENVVKLIESGNVNSVQLAESIGARPSTVVRLLEEGRKNRRLEQQVTTGQHLTATYDYETEGLGGT